MKLTRRDFIRTGVVAGLGVLAGYDRPSHVTKEPDEKSLLRKLGRTELRITPVGFGGQHTRNSELIRYAFDQGINYIETAWGYGFGKSGNSCECIGKAIKGIRDKVYLFVAYVGRAPSTSKASVDNQFKQTLRDLDTDYIDVLLWHQPNSLDEILKGYQIDLMERWKSAGKIRYCGVTAHENQAIYLKHIHDSDVYDVAVVAFNYSSPPELAQAIEQAAQKGVGIIAMKTQSPNFMEKHELGTAPDHRKALSWVLAKKYVHGAIPGMTTKEQVNMDIEVMNS